MTTSTPLNLGAEDAKTRKRWGSPGRILFVGAVATLIVVIILLFQYDPTTRSRTNTPSQPSTARDLLCGPNVFVDGTGTRTQPLRLTRELSCQIEMAKTDDMDAEIRFNGNSEWIPWPAFEDVPTASTLVRTFEVRPLQAHDQVYVVANFPHQR